MSKKNKVDKKPKNIDYAAEDNYNPARTLIYVEHSEECPIFKIKALEFLAFCEKQFPDRLFVLLRNKEPPREDTFEISMSQTARTPITLLWSGKDNGPPRRDKFPNFNDLLPAITTLVKKVIVDPNAKLQRDSFDDLGDGEDDAGI